MRMTASWFESDIFRVHRIQGCEAMVASQTAGSPQVDGRNAALPRRNELFYVRSRTSLAPCSGASKGGCSPYSPCSPAKGGLRVAPCGSAPAAKRRRL
jgi:hypothetical protein